MGQYNSTIWGGGALGGTPITVTAAGLSYDALRDLQVIRPGNTPSAEQYADALKALNQMVDEWSIDRLMIPYMQRELYPLDEGVQEYASIPRPIRIDGAAILTSGSTTETPIEVLSRARYLAGAAGVYCDDQFATATWRINPAPSSGDQLVLWTWTPFNGFGSLDEEYTFPPGYAKALRWNLGLDLAPSFGMFAKGQPLYDLVLKHATSSKAQVKRHNAPSLEITCDPSMSPRQNYDYLSRG